MISKGIRGAITVDENTKEALEAAVVELIGQMFFENNIENDLISHVIFTMTEDLTAEFPAKIAREKFNFRNSILLTVMDQANDLRVEWLEDNSGLTWDGDKVLKSTTGGFELTIGENKTSIVVYDPDGNYDVEDRVKKGVHLILNS